MESEVPPLPIDLVGLYEETIEALASTANGTKSHKNAPEKATVLLIALQQNPNLCEHVASDFDTFILAASR